MNDSYPGWIKPLISKVFSFSYSLIPDELQAQQLVIDSFQYVTLNFNKLLDTELEDEQIARSQVFNCLLRKTYELSVKRAAHLSRQEFNERDEFEAFYSDLDTQQRAIIFLYHRFQFSVERIMEVTGLNRFQIIADLHRGRNELGHTIILSATEEGRLIHE